MAKTNKTEQRLKRFVKGESYAYTDGFEKYDSEWRGSPKEGVFTGQVEKRKPHGVRRYDTREYWMAELNAEVFNHATGERRKAKIWRQSRQIFMTWARHEQRENERKAKSTRSYNLNARKRVLQRELRLQVADILMLPRQENPPAGGLFGEEPAVGEIGRYRTTNDVGVEADIPEPHDPEKAVIESVSLQVDHLSLSELATLVEFVRDEIWDHRPEKPEEN